MKKVFGGLVAAVIILTSSACLAGTLSYFNYNDYVYNSGSAKIAQGSGYTYKLMKDDSGDGIDGVGIDETEVDSGSGWNGSFPGIFSDSTPDTLNTSDKVFIRVWNPGSTEYVIVDAEEGTGTFEPTYTVTLTGGLDSHRWGGAEAGEWQPVPEPASLALFGLGVAVVAIRRRMSK